MARSPKGPPPDSAGQGGADGPVGRNGRSAARLLAVQALYQIEMTGDSPGQVLQEFLSYRLCEEIGGLRHGPVDRSFFVALVEGTAAQRADLDDMIAAVLDPDWSVERLQRLLRVILRAGAYELSEDRRVPAKVAVNEYVDLAHAFFDDKEPGLVNAVLDRLARALRIEEFSRRPKAERTGGWDDPDRDG